MAGRPGELRGRQIRGERSLGLLEPARELTNSARHQLDDGALSAVGAQLRGALIQNTGHVVKIVPGFVDDRGGASEERQGGGNNDRGAKFLLLRHDSMVAQPALLGQAPGRRPVRRCAW
jgi:hypothetical protein